MSGGGEAAAKPGGAPLWVRALLFLIGAAALAWFAFEVDWHETGRLLARLGRWAPLVPIPYALVYMSDTAGWLFCFRATPAVRWFRLYRIRWAGESVNSLIPSGYVGGEAVKVLLLKRLGVSSADSTVAAVLSKTQQSVAQLVFIGLGALAFVRLGTAPSGFSRAMALVFGLGALLLVCWFALQRRGVFASVAGVVRWIRWLPRSWVASLERLSELDGRILRFFREHPGRYAGSFAAYLGGWLLDTIELMLVGALLGMPLDWSQALAVEAFTGVAKALGVLIPGALGVQESSIVFLCRMAGVPESLGAAYAVIRRVRELLFAAIGWKFLLWEQVRLRDLAESDNGHGRRGA